MLEALLLVIALIILSNALPLSAQFLLLIGVTALVIPGLYATKTGAPFVPTQRRIFRRMVELAAIKPHERVYDLGCGDGRFVFAATKLGAQATGYELSFPTWLVAKTRSFFYPGSSIRYKNFWVQDYRDADVIFCFLLTSTMQDFKSIVWPQLKPGTRVVSHAFRMKDVEPTHREKDVIVYIK